MTEEWRCATWLLSYLALIDASPVLEHLKVEGVPGGGPAPDLENRGLRPLNHLRKLHMSRLPTSVVDAVLDALPEGGKLESFALHY